MIQLIRRGQVHGRHAGGGDLHAKGRGRARARFQVGLEKAAGDATGLEKDRLAEAVRHVERVFLGTIHSFCGGYCASGPWRRASTPSLSSLTMPLTTTFGEKPGSSTSIAFSPATTRSSPSWRTWASSSDS